MEKKSLLLNSKNWKEKTKASFLVLFGAVLSVTQLQGQTFSYTGSVQSVTLTAGSYDIEMWGANGGDAKGGTGGKGGYSKGTLTVTAPTTYYIYVGGKGSTVSTSTPGGWNGGGSCLGTHSTGNNGGTGGGGTDIRTTENTTYADRLMVAGGGGGATGYNSYTGNGGNGGGLTGENGTSSRSSSYFGGGGSQTAGGALATGSIASYNSAGALGTGGNYNANGTLGGNAGGGGYYGGGGAHWGGGGGGGSSYIGGVTAGVTFGFGQTGYVANPDTTGNGHVIITNSVMSTSEVGAKTNISVFPNPTTEVLNITNVTDRTEYKIYNMTGQLLKSGKVSNKKVDVSNLDNGVYMIDLKDSNINAKVKFIKK